MIPSKDIYADKDGKVTSDPLKYASQVAVAGYELDDRIAKRYGISDQLVSVDEPGAVRVVKGKAEPEPEPEAVSDQAAEAAEAASPVEVEEPKPAAKKPAAKKGAGKK